MSKQISVIGTTARSAIVASFVGALETADNTGSLVTQVCNTAARYLKGEPFPADDMNSVVADIAKARGWKDPVLKVRSSEVRSVLRAYAELPEAVSMYRKKSNSCTWHVGIKLARLIHKSKGNVGKAVKLAFEHKDAAPVAPSARCAGALKAWYKEARGEKRAAILKAAAILGLKLGVE